jgi:hypothetical protein
MTRLRQGEFADCARQMQATVCRENQENEV